MTDRTQFPTLPGMEMVPALTKTDAIISYLEKNSDGAYLKEISYDLNIPKSTTHRILSTLIQLHYVELNPDSTRYSLGPKFLAIARSIEKKLSLSRIAIPIMQETGLKLMETVKLSVLKYDKVYVIASTESPRKVKITVESGTVFPPHIGAAGKLLLAWADPADQARIIKTPLERNTDNTIVCPETLTQTLNKIRDQGYATDNEEETAGIRAIAFPVHDASMHVIAALSIPYLAVLRSEKELFGELEACALRISRALGSPL